jgi:hypothetical protein
VDDGQGRHYCNDPGALASHSRDGVILDLHSPPPEQDDIISGGLGRHHDHSAQALPKAAQQQLIVGPHLLPAPQPTGHKTTLPYAPQRGAEQVGERECLVIQP